MGMAASQARYLALCARKSNCEYEGQQINQSRLNLSNQSANLFNQMLGLKVPTPPSVQDYTKTQYSFTDGYNNSVIDYWQQLANPDDDGYNYVVQYHYEANVYKGYDKKLNDPQIQFSYNVPTTTDYTAEKAAISAIFKAQNAVSDAQKAYDEAKADFEAFKAKAKQLTTYRDAVTMYNKAQITDHTTNAYTIFDNETRSAATNVYQYLSYNLIGTNSTLKTASLWQDSDGKVYTEYADGRSAVNPGTTLYAVDCTDGDPTTGTLSTKKPASPPEGTCVELTSKYNNYDIIFSSNTREYDVDAAKIISDAGAVPDGYEKTGKTFNNSELWYDSTGTVYTSYAEGRTKVNGETVYVVGSNLNTGISQGTLSINKPAEGVEGVDFVTLPGAYGNFNLLSSTNKATEKTTEKDVKIFQGDNPPEGYERKVYGTAEQRQALDDALKTWRECGVDFDNDNVYYDAENNLIAFREDLDNLNGVGQKYLRTLYVYDIKGPFDSEASYQSIEGVNKHLSELEEYANDRFAELQTAQMNLDSLNIPTYVGNSKLTALSELTDNQMAEIRQIITDMNANDTNCHFPECFESTLSLNKENYSGGIYSFELNGITYYTTYYDLADTAAKSTFTNDVDNQPKLNYYYATYVKDNIYENDKAILETDARGRFKSVRFSNGGTYTLNFEEITDDVAYQDAVNEYNYKAAQYDKMIQDINAKTSLIQQQDQQLELRMKQLETEQNALSQEMEAVQKVVKDNVEKSFKTFGG